MNWFQIAASTTWQYPFFPFTICRWLRVAAFLNSLPDGINNKNAYAVYTTILCIRCKTTYLFVNNSCKSRKFYYNCQLNPLRPDQKIVKYGSLLQMCWSELRRYRWFYGECLWICCWLHWGSLFSYLSLFVYSWISVCTWPVPIIPEDV